MLVGYSALNKSYMRRVHKKVIYVKKDRDKYSGRPKQPRKCIYIWGGNPKN